MEFSRGRFRSHGKAGLLCSEFGLFGVLGLGERVPVVREGRLPCASHSLQHKGEMNNAHHGYIPVEPNPPAPRVVSSRLATSAKAARWTGAGTSWAMRSPRAISNGSAPRRSEEHTSELQSLMRISYAVFCLKKKKETYKTYN